MHDFGPVVLAPALFMVRHQADLTKRGPIGAQLVGGNPVRGKALLLEQRTHQLAGRRLVPSALDENLHHLALIIDGPPQVPVLAPVKPR